MKRLTNLFTVVMCVGIAQAQLPGFSWGHSVGNYDSDIGNAVAVDNSGNVIIAGVYKNTVDFDPGPGTASLQSNGNYDLFVEKFDANGNMLWVIDVGSNSSVYDEAASGLAVDASGNIYVCGYFKGQADFDPGPGVFNMSAGGGLGYGSPEMFILKLDASGNFVWAKSFAGYNHNKAHAITVDAGGNVYTTGYFSNPVDFDMGPGTAMASPVGEDDMYILKLNSSGDYVWSVTIGDAGDEHGTSIKHDNGHIFVTGWFEGTVDFDPGAGTAILGGNSDMNLFLLKFTDAGAFVWARGYGGNILEARGNDLHVGASGDVYITGAIRGVGDIDPGPGVTLDTIFYTSVMAAKFNPDGDQDWIKIMRSKFYTSYNWGSSISTDVSGNVYVAGMFADSLDFDPGAGTFYMYPRGNNDIFLQKLNSSGNFEWATQFGGATQGFYYMHEDARDLHIGNGSEIYMTGMFRDTCDFNPGPGTNELYGVGAGWDNIFIVKLDQQAAGIIENELPSLSVYPNPTTGFTTIELELANSEVNVSIFDLSGRKLISVNYLPVNGFFKQTVDISSLHAGTYIVRIESSAGMFSQKLVVQ